MDPAEPSNPAPGALNAIAVLRRFARARPQGERCDLCAAPLSSEHQHLLEPESRKLSCACDACAILFGGQTKYRRVPRRIECWPEFKMTDEHWATLGIPISLAFFFHSTPAGEVMAVYPSPAGPTESPLAAEAWEAVVEENPGLRKLEPDVEALLVNRVGEGRACYRVPIDECYKLVGLVRTHWRGMSGGTEVWRHIAAFFDDLKRRSVGARAHA